MLMLLLCTAEPPAPPPAPKPALADDDRTRRAPNPFLAQRNDRGSWDKPRVSLRIQAKLAKAAKSDPRVAALLPPGPKFRPPPLERKYADAMGPKLRRERVARLVDAEMEQFKTTAAVPDERGKQAAARCGAQHRAAVQQRVERDVPDGWHGAGLTASDWMQEIAWTSDAARLSDSDRAHVGRLDIDPDTGADIDT